jgi:hypothetical protein
MQIEQAIAEAGNIRTHRIEVYANESGVVARLVATPRDMVLEAAAGSATAAVFNLKVNFEKWYADGGRLVPPREPAAAASTVATSPKSR